MKDHKILISAVAFLFYIKRDLCNFNKNIRFEKLTS